MARRGRSRMRLRGGATSQEQGGEPTSHRQGAYNVIATTSPTDEGITIEVPSPSPPATSAMGVYYPVWDEERCSATPSLPANRRTYSTMFACCKAAFGGPASGE